MYFLLPGTHDAALTFPLVTFSSRNDQPRHDTGNGTINPEGSCDDDHTVNIRTSVVKFSIQHFSSGRSCFQHPLPTKTHVLTGSRVSMQSEYPNTLHAPRYNIGDVIISHVNRGAIQYNSALVRQFQCMFRSPHHMLTKVEAYLRPLSPGRRTEPS